MPTTRAQERLLWDISSNACVAGIERSIFITLPRELRDTVYQDLPLQSQTNLHLTCRTLYLECRLVTYTRVPTFRTR